MVCVFPCLTNFTEYNALSVNCVNDNVLYISQSFFAYLKVFKRVS